MVPATNSADDYRVLGPVEVVRSGSPVGLGGHRQRWLLALLLVEPGQVVSADRLIDELWQGTPPRGAAGTLRVYVSRLRRSLGADVVVARPPGYLLDVDPELVDATRFSRLLRAGSDALAREAAGLSAERLHAALALWRGPAFADVRDHGRLVDEARRLDELRMVALEERIAADLALGRHASVVAELEGLVAKTPLRERLWRHLVLALYRAHGAADALAAYERARTLLAEDLGLDPGDELRELERAVLRQELDAPAPATDRHNLPAPLTSFVGREEDLVDLTDRLRTHRVVTLTGAGGSGKTRLALEAATRQRGAWADGVWLVDLTSIADPSATASAVGRALGMRERPGASATEGLVAHLRDQELLIVLDNCEHVARACAELVHEVVRWCPSVRVLATSRVPLGTPGEVDHAVGPLPVPADGQGADEVAQLSSVRLFLERAGAQRRDLDPHETLESVARICRELDGLPLAIELAAARTKSLSIADIASRLDDRLGLLRAERPQANPRHETMRATVDWSHELLADDERDLFAALSVFVGGFGLDAAAAVCLDRDAELAEELLSRLVGSSLVMVGSLAGPTRYQLLETIREYAAERLDPSRREDLLRAHAQHFCEVAGSARTDDPARKLEALALLDRERGNLAVAIGWALRSRSDLALPLTVRLRHYWLIRGDLRQGLAWLEEALLLPPVEPSPTRASALSGAALLARLLGHSARAAALAREAVELARAVGPPQALVVSLNVLTTRAAQEGDLGAARGHRDESVATARAAGDRRLEALAHFTLAEAHLHAGRYDEVDSVGAEALALAREVGDREVMSIVLARTGMAAALDGRPEAATARLGDALEHARLLGFPDTAAWCCEGLALVAAERGEADRAARLLGAGESLRRAGGGVAQPAEARAREAALTSLRRTLVETDLEAAREIGRGYDLATAAREARAAAS